MVQFSPAGLVLSYAKLKVLVQAGAPASPYKYLWKQLQKVVVNKGHSSYNRDGNHLTPPIKFEDIEKVWFHKLLVVLFKYKGGGNKVKNDEIAKIVVVFTKQK